MAEYLKPLLQFAVLRPGLAMMAVGLAVLAWKVRRHASKGSKYSLWDAWRYPDDALLTLGAVVLFVVGLVRMFT